ncbi:hypothetical protein CONPUDRAFT_79107 [Coniophora puteana RWD-64-598 SS2]|uniref:Uncharacterized protein n=1 Tax=Coniophora puteana (strain RWD-64-598) TaxID=741705 RepID=A0A5M3N662_CONPW|nr:uncharacterized protein CONPUDRAFT_79107 [Coniophora puteana RWD-64-598 SS2]EIW86903.1 hypothetical protein CONPUDRAFT_79107 [Coniophora puteana RWD-64-598 SS2]
MTADDSPLSRASILANPPTPYSVTEPTVELPAVEKAATSATRAGAGATNGVGAEKVAPRESDPGRAISPSSKRAAARENGGPRDREVESLTLSKRAGERVSVVGRDRDRESSPTKKAAAPVQEEARLVKSASASGKKAESRGVGRKTSDRAAAAPAAPVVPVANGVSAQAYVSNSPDAPRRRRTKDKAEKYERVERADREREREKERADRAERAERSERRERERERGERYYERSERYYERGERTERERGERSERAERSDRTERERAKSGRDREREREREREKERERDRDRERYRERDRDSKRDSRRESRREQYDVADSRRRVTSQGAHQTPADDGNRYSRGRGADVPQPQPQPRAGPSSREKPRSPIRDEDFQPYYPSGVRNSVASSQLDSAHAARPVSNVYTTSTHERMSTSGRPTSELPPASELNAFRAREHWEMDRLWKGRSMYQGQPETTVIASPQSVVGAQLTNGDARNHHASITAHGSNHTAYVVQPLQAHAIPANMFYANMPSAPPPIIYAATSPPGQLPQQHYQQQQQQHASRPEFTSLPSSFVFPSKDTAAAAASPTTTSGGTSGSPPPRNPLPPPPRESNYQAAPLPDYSGSASEYWTKHASVTTH